MPGYIGLARGLRLAGRFRGLATYLASIGALLWGSDYLVDGDSDTLT